MKSKFLFSLVLCLLFSSQSYTQSIRDVGIRIGITSSNQSMPQYPDSKRRTGFVGGGFIEWNTIPMLSLVTQVEFVNRGCIIEMPRTDANSPDPVGIISIDSKLSYFSFSVYAKFYLKIADITPYIIVGPRIDYLFDYNSDAFQSIYNDFKKVIFSGQFGFGLEVDSELPVRPYAELRYVFDFTDSYKPDNYKIRNNSFDITFGVLF
ncbi:MAG: hypothetical protein A2V66_09795 [Ignavibacteria bacterium RBG_13_36_8]|nr:MAG: hypothetical protein A2V66_09795 [Ignavibacteria bacterium RBG_13_36_8]